MDRALGIHSSPSLSARARAALPLGATACETRQRTHPLAWIMVGVVFVTPSLVSAHEVYVLDAATVGEAMNTPSVNPFLAYTGNEYQFFFWGFFTAVVA